MSFAPLRPIWPATRIIAALMLREMSTRYGRLSGGYLWAILEPVGVIALLTFLFSHAFRSPPIGTSFALFYASAYLPLSMYADLAEKTAAAITFSRQLLSYPVISFVDALIARFLLNGLTQQVIIALVLVGISLLEGIAIRPDLGKLGISLGMAAALGFGLGVLNCLLFTALPIWHRIWVVLTKPLFLVSCLFYTFGTLPTVYRDILWYNPLVHVVGQMRAALYPTYDASYVSALYVLVLSLVSATVGMVLLSRFRETVMQP